MKGAVYDDATIIKETRHEVDSQIYSQSDTTVTTVTSESLNVSSDSEPEIVIHRKKTRKKKKKIHHEETNYLESGCKFRFPLRKVIPDSLCEKCVNQMWCGIKIKSGLKEG